MNLIGYKAERHTGWNMVEVGSDYNGDGKSDVMMRNDDGRIEYRLMDGVTLAGVKAESHTGAWHIVNTDALLDNLVPL